MGSEPAEVYLGDKADSRSTRELVMSLRPEFQSSKFELVASILASREEKLKREIAAKVEENHGLWLEKERVRLENIKLEHDLKSCKMEAEKAFKKMEDRVMRIGDEEMKKLQAKLVASSEDVGREKLGIEMNVKKENEKGQNGGGGGNIGLNNMKSHQADTGAGKRAIAQPKPAGDIIVEISDSDDESSPSKAQKGGTSNQPHLEAGHLGIVAIQGGATGEIKRKYSSSSANDKSGHPEKLTRYQDSIHIGRTFAAPAKLSSPKLQLAALAAMSSSSSSSSSDDEFDPSTEINFKPCL